MSEGATTSAPAAACDKIQSDMEKLEVQKKELEKQKTEFEQYKKDKMDEFEKSMQSQKDELGKDMIKLQNAFKSLKSINDIQYKYSSNNKDM